MAARKYPPLKERFWAKVTVGTPGGCWLWNAQRLFGYGRFKVEGKMRCAHHIAWMLTHGEIPHGMFLCHRCDNPGCVNPAHLFLGTHDDNMRDMVAKRRQARGDAHGSAKISARDVRKIRALGMKGEVRRKIAADFGIEHSTVGDILTGRSWAHV